MAPRTFTDVLRAEVSRMQSAHPEREGEIARANTLITLGMVTPSPDDPTTGLVRSSDLQTTYTVNGTCDCPAGQREKACKHVAAWWLFQYIQGKLTAQAAQEPQEAISPTQTTADTSRPVDASPGLPEAPASATVHLTISGRDVMFTLRDSDEERLLARLQAMLERYPVAENSTAADAREGWCHVHNVQMRQTTKDGRSWYSHKTADGQWCKGKGRR